MAVKWMNDCYKTFQETNFKLSWYLNLNDVLVCILSWNMRFNLSLSVQDKFFFLGILICPVSGDVEGEMKVNGYYVNREIMMQLSGFVPQEDLCVNSLSVIEHMKFMVRLSHSS